MFFFSKKKEKLNYKTTYQLGENKSGAEWSFFQICVFIL